MSHDPAGALPGQASYVSSWLREVGQPTHTGFPGLWSLKCPTLHNPPTLHSSIDFQIGWMQPPLATQGYSTGYIKDKPGIHSLIHSFNKYLLKANYLLGTKLHAQNKKTNKGNKVIALTGLTTRRDKIVWEFCQF